MRCRWTWQDWPASLVFPCCWHCLVFLSVMCVSHLWVISMDVWLTWVAAGSAGAQFVPPKVKSLQCKLMYQDFYKECSINRL